MGAHGYLMSGSTAAWIRRQMDRKAPSAAAVATRRTRPAVVEEDEFARPFEVRFASGDGADESGKWIIWLPSDSMLIVNGKPVDLTAELEEAGEPYPEGWYILDFLSEGGGDVFLNVNVPAKDEDEGEVSEGGGEEDEREVSAAFASTAGQPEEGFVIYPIKIAECSPGGVKSTVGSAVVLGGGGSGSMAGVTSLNYEDGALNVIGGKKIRVTTVGKTIKISIDEEKSDEDPDPNNKPDPCDHPGNEGGSEGEGDDTPGHGGGGTHEAEEETGDTGGGGGCSGCGGNSTTGGSGTGSPQPGAPGKPAEGATGGGKSAPGKEVTAPPTGQGSSGAATSETGGKPAAGLLGASSAKSPIYTGTHSTLTSSKTMNESPFKTSGNYRPIGSGSTTPIANTNPIYQGTHSKLTNANTLNESPFRRK